MLCIEYFWLLNVQVQFGAIQYISDFRQSGTCAQNKVRHISSMAI